MAPLGNTKEDKYYRNDSPVKCIVVSMCLALSASPKGERIPIVGGGLLKYCRHEEKKEKEN